MVSPQADGGNFAAIPGVCTSMRNVAVIAGVLALLVAAGPVAADLPKNVDPKKLTPAESKRISEHLGEHTSRYRNTPLIFLGRVRDAGTRGVEILVCHVPAQIPVQFTVTNVLLGGWKAGEITVSFPVCGKPLPDPPFHKEHQMIVFADISPSGGVFSTFWLPAEKTEAVRRLLRGSRRRR